jgi:hypothetical protein
MYVLNGHQRAAEQPAHLRFLILDFRRWQRLYASASLWQNLESKTQNSKNKIEKKFVTVSHGPSRGLTPFPCCPLPRAFSTKPFIFNRFTHHFALQNRAILPPKNGNL